jgi:hypothetical protein
VLLIPPQQTDSSELASVVLESALPKRSLVVRDAIYACGLATFVPAIHIAPEGARLVVDTGRGQIWVDTVEITGIPAGTHPFQFVEMLARSPTGCVSANEIVSKLSSGREDDTAAARQAKITAKRSIVEAMTAAGRTFVDDPFPSGGRGSYRCILPGFVQ